MVLRQVIANVSVVILPGERQFLVMQVDGVWLEKGASIYSGNG